MDTAKKAQKRRILIVDDEKEIVSLIDEVARQEGYDTELAYDGQEALDKYRNNKPGLVILDIDLPKINGLAVCEKIKMDAEFIPAILITGKLTSIQNKVNGLRSGADDYLTKPFDVSELLARIKAMSRLKDLYDELSRANKKLEEISLVDALTGAYNRRYLYNNVESEIKRAARAKNQLSCLILDVDRFKDTNDTRGHAAGDAVLIGLADMLKASVRQTDSIARYGGDEFFIVAPATDQKGAGVLADKLLKKIRQSPINCQGDMIRITVSIGFCTFDASALKDKFLDAASVKAIYGGFINKADKALYEAKKSGRDRVCSHENK